MAEHQSPKHRQTIGKNGLEKTIFIFIGNTDPPANGHGNFKLCPTLWNVLMLIESSQTAHTRELCACATPIKTRRRIDKLSTEVLNIKLQTKMCQVNVEEAEESPSSLLVCDRCEKVRRVPGDDVPDGRWTCCHQPTEFSTNTAAGKKWKRAAPRPREE